MSAYVTKVLGESKSVADLTDEQAQLIAYSCVIDNGNESAYDSPMFPTKGVPLQRETSTTEASRAKKLLIR